MTRLLKILLLVIFLACSCSPPPPEKDLPAAAEVERFRDMVLAQLREAYPEYQIEATDDPEVLAMKDVTLGLQNVYAIYRNEGLTEQDLPALLEDRFGNFLKNYDELIKNETPTWENAAPLIMPQFMPKNYLDRISVPYFEFCEDVVIAFVLDQDKHYQYVTDDNLRDWDAELSRVNTAALENLDRISKGTPIQTTEGPNLFLAVETDDGYDAARILSPRFREFAVSRLGEPFMAAVPNRDFLIMWPTDASEQFKSHMRKTVAEDYQTEPYPLTPLVFSVTRDSIKVAAPSGQ